MKIISKSEMLQKKLLQYDVAHELETGKIQNRNIDLECQRVKDQIQILRLILLTNQTKLTICFATLHNTRTRQNPTIFSTLFSGAGRSKMVTISINLSAHSEASKILLATFLLTPKRHLYIFKTHKAGPIAIDLFKDLFQSLRLHNRLLTPTAVKNEAESLLQTPKCAGNAGRSHY